MGSIFDCCCSNSTDREVKLLYHINRLERERERLKKKNSLLKKEIYEVSRIVPIRNPRHPVSYNEYKTY